MANFSRNLRTIAKSVAIFVVLGPLIAGGFLVVSEPLAVMTWFVGAPATVAAGLLFGSLVVSFKPEIVALLRGGHAAIVSICSGIVGAAAGIAGLTAFQLLVEKLDPNLVMVLATWNVRLLSLFAGAVCGVGVVVTEMTVMRRRI